ncbi:hypothetical protein D9Q98_007335 [Chlorella vulgaris]|uniref:Uncharacterized protein n=1 Tax=Chlorella vulgaris TaxID=3077 RepID=A0A9D4TL06_CHLVU|nr:hypothetical protein D9Q98_007335 [Chlorella vulgaris]
MPINTVLRRAWLAAASRLPTISAAPCTHLATPNHIRQQTTSTHSPPDDPLASSSDFQRVADLYLGSLWSKLSEGLKGKATAELEHDSMKLALPDGGKIVITKEPESRSLVVHSTLHDFFGSDGAENEVAFRLQPDYSWEQDGEELHDFLEDGLAKHLKVQVDLEVEPQTLYGPDPT